jgi:hypothetical protein
MIPAACTKRVTVRKGLVGGYSGRRGKKWRTDGEADLAGGQFVLAISACMRVTTPLRPL